MQGTLKSAYEVSRLAASGKDASRALGAAVGYWRAIEAVVASAKPAVAARVNAALDVRVKPSATAYTQVRRDTGDCGIEDGGVCWCRSTPPGSRLGDGTGDVF